MQVKIAGSHGVPADATAVALNITAVSASLPTYVTAWPAGASRPTTSTLNVSGAQATPNFDVVAVGAGGSVDFYNHTGQVNLLADIAGYYTAGPGAVYTPISPVRAFDTRTGAGGVSKTPVGAGRTIDVTIGGTHGVPWDAEAVALNITAVSATTSTYVTAWPTGQERPGASNLNVASRGAVPNFDIVAVGVNGRVSFYNHAGSVNLLADIAGYFTASGAVYTPVTPVRAFDTRTGTGGVAIRPLGPGQTLRVKIAGLNGVPGNASAVVLNITAVSATTSTYVTAWPAGETRPTASNLNVTTPYARANLDPASVGAGGEVSFYNHAGSINLLADIAGYFTPIPPPLTWQQPTTIDPGGSLTSVSCGTANFCVAVDFASRVVTFDGTGWSAPRVVDTAGHLGRVSCVSATFCVAVDDAGNAVTFNGTGWSSPTPIDPGGLIESVSCPTSTFCAAVDFDGRAMTFNGTRWTTPVLIDSVDYLYAVSCATSSFCVTVDNSGYVSTFNGTRWTAPAPVGPAGGDSVACPSTTFCAAVGLSGETAIFTGSAWKGRTSLDSGLDIYSVSCSTVTFCAAVGLGGNTFFFDGVGWTTPHVIESGGFLESVSCPTTSLCVAIDDNGNAIIGRA